MTTALSRRPAVIAVAVYLSIRLVGVLMLAWLGHLHGAGLAPLLQRWDGEWMLSIAAHGYDGVSWGTDAKGVRSDTTAYAFFPGYPALVGVVDTIPFVSTFAAGLLVNLVAGCAAAVGVARLGALCATRMRPSVTADQARRTGLILTALSAAAPMAVVLSMTYTEALFCALAVWALVGVLEERWMLAGLCAFSVGLVRPTGVAVIAVVMLAAGLARRDGPRVWAAGLVAPLGYLAYLGVVWAKTGSPTGWFQIQTAGWDTSFDGGRATADHVIRTLTEPTDTVAIATTVVIGCSIALLAWSFLDRMPWPVTLYATLVMCSVLLSSGLIASRPRLLLPAFVILLPVAIRLAGASRATIVAVTGGAALASAWFGAYMLTVFEYAI